MFVGSRPDGIDTVEDSLALELVEALDGVLGIDGVALGNESADKVGHAFRAAFEAETVLADAELLLDFGEGVVEGHHLEALLE